MSIPISKHMEHMNPSLIREIFKAAQKEGMISFTAGSPSAEEFPAQELAALAKDVFATQAVTVLSYGVTEGYQPLRQWIADDLQRSGIQREGDDTIVISGGQQAIRDGGEERLAAMRPEDMPPDIRAAYENTHRQTEVSVS